MKICIHPIATITKTSGTKGNVRLRPLSRYFDEYIHKNRLMLGYESDSSRVVSLEFVTGVGKKRKFKFKGFNSIDDAERIVGKTLFVQADADENINLISKNLLGFNIKNTGGKILGTLKDIMWLPSNDVYVIENQSNEYLIPVVPEIVKYVKHDERSITIVQIEGLLE